MKFLWRSELTRAIADARVGEVAGGREGDEPVEPELERAEAWRCVVRLLDQVAEALRLRPPHVPRHTAALARRLLAVPVPVVDARKQLARRLRALLLQRVRRRGRHPQKEKSQRRSDAAIPPRHVRRPEPAGLLHLLEVETDTL